MTTEVQTTLGIPAVASISGTTSGSITFTVGKSVSFGFEMKTQVTLQPGEYVYPIVYIWYRDMYSATIRYNSELMGYQYCYDCADWGTTYSVTDIYSHRETHATFYSNDGSGIAPKICYGSPVPLNLPPVILDDGETLIYTPGKNWANY
ncbi:MAG: hypothetical protein LBJ00_10185 [Planctomycetaceae bacterium]|nr:hypothetical protein [Planctomycetaceae bacterium]